MHEHETTPNHAEIRDPFEVHENKTDDLEVVEFETAPLTDLNFGF